MLARLVWTAVIFGLCFAASAYGWGGAPGSELDIAVRELVTGF